MKKRISYSNEFKKDAASLVIDQGYTFPEACTAVGVSRTALTNWTKQLKDERSGITPDSPAFTCDQKEIQALRKEIKRIEWENDILKKATALLISDTIK